MENNTTYNFGLKTFTPTNTKFFEVVTSTGRIEAALAVGENNFEKIKITLQKLAKNKEGKTKQVGLIDFYVDVNEFVVNFVHDLRSDRFREKVSKDLQKGLEAAKNNETVYGQTFIQKIGGTPASRLKAEKARGGKAEYRELKLARSNYNDKLIKSSDTKDQVKAKTPRFVLSALKCDGEEKDMGAGRMLFVPIKKDGKHQNAETVMIPLTYEQLMELSYAVEREVNAYRTAQYILASLNPKLEELERVKKAEAQANEINAEAVVSAPVEETQEVSKAEAKAVLEAEDDDDDIIF